MRSGAPRHPFGHGAPLDDQERARLQVIAQQHADDLGPVLRWPSPALAVPGGRPGRRALQASGWPVWVALLLGMALVDGGVRAEQGWWLLAGTVLAVTSPHWLGLPPLAALAEAARAAWRRQRDGRS